MYSLSSRYSWTPSEVEKVNRASVLLAADVIYSDELTDAFFSVLEKMMCQHSEKVLKILAKLKLKLKPKPFYFVL